MVLLQTFDNKSDPEPIVSTLTTDGGVIIADQVSDDLIDQISRELSPHFDAEGHKFRNDFNGYKTSRLGGILALSTTSQQLIAHSRVTEIADRVLKPHCVSYGLVAAPRLRYIQARKIKRCIETTTSIRSVFLKSNFRLVRCGHSTISRKTMGRRSSRPAVKTFDRFPT